MEYDVTKNTIPGTVNNPDLLWLFNMAKEMESVVEITFEKGRSTHALLSGCKGTVYSVNPFFESSNEVHDEFVKNVGDFKNLAVLKMSSESAVERFEDNSVDMVFLNGSHVYEELIVDIKRWLPKARKILCGRGRRTLSVRRAVEEMFGSEGVLGGWKRGEEDRRGDMWIKIKRDAYLPAVLDEHTAKKLNDYFVVLEGEINREEKLRWYAKIFDTDSDHREALLQLANIYLSENNYPAVIVYAEASLTISGPSHARIHTEDEPHRLLYLAYGFTGNIAKAKEHNLKALDYSPHNPEHIRNMKHYMSLPKVSICMPTLRKDKIDGVMQAIKDNAGYENYEVLLNDEPIGFSKSFNKLVSESSGELVMVMADDTYPEKNFLQIAVAAMFRHYPDMDGLVKVSEGFKRRHDFAAYWLASKKLLPALDGKFFHEEYHHYFVDYEITRRVKKIGKYVQENRCILRHFHPSITAVEADEIHLKWWNLEHVKHDALLFEARCKLLEI